MSNDVNTYDNKRFDDSELKQHIETKTSLAQKKLDFLNARYRFNAGTKFAEKLREYKILSTYDSERDRRYYFFDDETGNKDPFYSHRGNRDISNELAIFLKKNMRQILHHLHIEYRATLSNYRHQLRKDSGQEFDENWEKSGVVETSSKMSFLQHEIEWFLKNT